ncbi:hypothetical protein AB0I00_37730 [Streptomyces sp. NPDC050803]
MIAAPSLRERLAGGTLGRTTGREDSTLVGEEAQRGHRSPGRIPSRR